MHLAVRAAWVAVVLVGCGQGGDGPQASGGGRGAPAVIDPMRAALVAEVGAGDAVAAPAAGPVVVVSASALAIDGVALAAIRDGRVEGAGTADGRRIGPVVGWAEAWARGRPAGSTPPVRVAVAPTLPAALVVQVIGSFAAAGQDQFALVVRTPDGPGALPLTLPARAAADPGPVIDGTSPTRMALRVTGDRVILWSLSGLEGTLAAPRRELAFDAGGAWRGALRAQLVEIVRRRWDQRARPEADRTLVILVDDDATTGALIAAMVAVRLDDAGAPLFPDLRLTSIE